MFLVQTILLYNQCDAKKLIDSSPTKIDTVILSNNINNSENNYISKNELIDLLVKKSSSESWLTVLITSLGVLFAIMAIVVAFVIFIQSRDFKNKLNKAIIKYENLINDFIESKRKELKIQEESVKSYIQEYENALKTETSESMVQIHESINAKIKEKIRELESQKSIIEKQLKNSIVDAEYINQDNYSSFSGNPMKVHHTCTKCGQGFFIRDVNSVSGAISDAMPFYLTGYSGYSGFLDPKRFATCPKCGNVDII